MADVAAAISIQNVVLRRHTNKNFIGYQFVQKKRTKLEIINYLSHKRNKQISKNNIKIHNNALSPTSLQLRVNLP